MIIDEIACEDTGLTIFMIIERNQSKEGVVLSVFEDLQEARDFASKKGWEIVNEFTTQDDV